MPSCTCDKPRVSAWKGREDYCQCGRRLDPECLSSDATVDAFYTRLSEALFSYDKLTGELMVEPWFEAFVAEAKARERAGRGRFGFQYLARDNKFDANEEWTDGSNYLLFDSLQTIRDMGVDNDVDLVLDTMKYAALAYRGTLRLAAKRRSSPGPGMDE